MVLCPDVSILRVYIKDEKFDHIIHADIMRIFSTESYIEMFYLNTIKQLFLLVEQLDQLEVCLPYSRLLTGIQILVVFQNLRWNSNKTFLLISGEREKSRKNTSFHNVFYGNSF